jgi:hypothetical protein
VFLELAAEAIGKSGETQVEPISYEGIRERYLPEYEFHGKSQQHKSHYALTGAAMIRAGIYPDLLDEAHWWGDEDLWRYAFYALLAYARAAADRTGRTVEKTLRTHWPNGVGLRQSSAPSHWPRIMPTEPACRGIWPTPGVAFPCDDNCRAASGSTDQDRWRL